MCQNQNWDFERKATLRSADFSGSTGERAKPLKRLSGQLQGKFTRWQLSTERGSLARVERLKSAEP